MKTNTIQNFLRLILAVVLVAGFIACDSNTIRPEERGIDTSISINSFTVDSATLTKGESTILHWSVTDENSTVNSCQIYPDVGTVACSGTKQVTPQKSTVYTLTVISGGEAVREKSLQITVLSASGDEIVDDPVAEICDDEVDNDFNGAVDCADEACVETELCAGGEVTYSFTSSQDIAVPSIGDTITVSWVSNYSYTQIYLLEGIDIPSLVNYHAASDSITFTITSETTNIYINGFSKADGSTTYGGGVYQDSHTITITANRAVEENLEFSANINYFKIVPSTNLLNNQPYSLAWCVEDAAKVYIDGTSDSFCSSSDGYIASSGFISHRLFVEDENYPTTLSEENTDERAVKAKVAGFDSGSAFLSGVTIKKLIPGNDRGELFFITETSDVFQSTNYLNDEPMKIVSQSDLSAVVQDIEEPGNILSFAEAADGKYYIGTDKALFVKDSDGFKQMVYSTQGDEFNTIVVTENARVLVGSNTRLGLITNDTDDSDGYGTDTLDFYTYQANNYVIQFKQLLTNPSDPSELIAITSDAVYYSNDNGNNFTLLKSGYDFQQGSWSWDGQLIVWSSKFVFVMDKANGLTKNDNLSLGSIVVNYVVKQGSKFFIASSTGVSVLDEYYADAVKFDTFTDDNVNFLITGSSNALMKKTINALNLTGKKYSMEWTSMNAVTNYNMPVEDISAFNCKALNF